MKVEIHTIVPGQNFTAAGRTFTVLDKFEDEVLALDCNSCATLPLSNRNTDYKSSVIREYINDTYIPNLEGLGLSLVKDGFLVDGAAPLNDFEYRNYQEYISDLGSRWWLRPPMVGGYAVYIGDISICYSNDFKTEYNVRPAICLDSHQLVESIA